jgi:ATP-dependent DNA ligase
MRLPFDPPLAPMLSSAANALPSGEGRQFEPQWAGFRTLVFRDGDEDLLQSRDEKPMNRYFLELASPLVDDDSVLHHVGVAAASRMPCKRLVTELAPLPENELEGHPWRDWAETQDEANAQGQRLLYPGGRNRLA